MVNIVVKWDENMAKMTRSPKWAYFDLGLGKLSQFHIFGARHA